VSRIPSRTQDADGKTENRDYWFEMLAVFLLGIATIGSAWCGYQASAWSGEESRQARAATDYRVEASRLFALGTQKVAYDASIASQYATAFQSGNTALKKLIRDSLARKEFQPVIDQWEAKAAAGQTSFGNLLDNKQYMDTQFNPYLAAEAKAEAATARSAAAADTGDDYILTTLLMASALFFAGVASSFGSRSARILLIAGAMVVLALAAARLVDLPVA
jgi:hypothetical protein